VQNHPLHLDKNDQSFPVSQRALAIEVQKILTVFDQPVLASATFTPGVKQKERLKASYF
jgi:hypothetical protein